MESQKPPTLMAILAHPDDEVFIGGTFACYDQQGARTILVTATSGDVGEIRDKSLATPDNLATVRANELQRSVQALGIDKLYVLGYRDSGMARTADNNHAASFHSAPLENAVERVVRIIREEKPEVIITANEYGDYGHPDHVKANRVAQAAFKAAGDANQFPRAGAPWRPRKLYYGAIPRSEMARWAEMAKENGEESWGDGEPPTDIDGNPVPLFTPDEIITTEIDTASCAAKKYAALHAHPTQFAADSFLFKAPADTLARLWPREYFRLIEGPLGAGPGERETDLFAGL
ncbi:MAG TPA: PIG-L family deacetylase [Chloroflexota bacterium]|nr:PIG-L family deacetylase [Chloroflexota bacterium]